MKATVKHKVIATLLLLVSAALVVFASDYISDYYEVRNSEVPRWVYCLAMALSSAALGYAFVNFMKAYPKKNKN